MKPNSKENSLSQRFSLATITVVIIISLALSLFSYIFNKNRYDRKLESRLEEVANIARVSLPTVLWNVDKQSMKDIVNSLFQGEDVVYFCLFDETGVLIEKKSPEFQSQDFTSLKKSSQFRTAISDVIYRGRKVATFQLAISDSIFRHELFLNIIVTAFLLGAIVIAIFITSKVVAKRHIFAPLFQLEASAELIACGEFETPIEIARKDEIGKLAETLDRMRQQLKHIVAELEDTNTNKEMIIEQRTSEYKKAKDDAEKANKAKDLFLASVSHELLTPLNSIVGFSHLLLATDLTDKQRDHLTMVYTDANDLKWIIRDILDYSKLQGGKFKIEKDHFQLDITLKGIERNFKNRNKEKLQNISFSLEKGPEIPAVLKGDRIRLKQVLYNLISNAFKYTDSGQITLKVSCLENNDRYARVQFSVSDSGCGISTENQNKIFLPFERILDKSKPAIKGIGLGLPITKELVESMGGTISIESEIGKGSTFTFALDFERCQDAEAYLKTPSNVVFGPENTEYLKEIHVLAVEDNPSSQKLIKEMLEKAGMSVDLAGDGETALQKIKGQNYDIVLMDYHIPIKDGYQTTMEIRKCEGKEDLPIIAMTASAPDELLEQFLTDQYADYLPKPIDYERLLRKITAWLPEEKKKQINDMADTQRISEKDLGAKVILEAAGLNVEDALERTKLSFNNYKKSLDSFLSSHVHSIDKLKEQLNQANYHHANLLSHNLKGSAANISALELASLSEKLENMTKMKMEDPAPLIAKLEDATNTVLNAIQNIFQNRTDSKTPSPPSDSINIKDLKISLESIKTLLKDRNTLAFDLLEPIMVDLPAFLPSETIKELEKHISMYNYDAILRVLKNISGINNHHTQ